MPRRVLRSGTSPPLLIASAPGRRPAQILLGSLIYVFIMFYRCEYRVSVSTDSSGPCRGRIEAE